MYSFVCNLISLYSIELTFEPVVTVYRRKEWLMSHGTCQTICEHLSDFYQKLHMTKLMTSQLALFVKQCHIVTSSYVTKLVKLRGLLPSY